MLTEEQKTLVKNVIKDIKDGKEVIKIGGFAGTGKTTIIKFILEVLKKKNLKTTTCAYTGKAADILRRKGIYNSSTIHSAIYEARTMEDDTISWSLKNSVDCDVFVVDEGSMVPEDIHKDLLSYGKQIIYVGDHGQLEPIGSKFNLMATPDYKLETIHRNAGEIALFANHLRNKLPATDFKGETKVQIVSSNNIKDEHLASVDQILCAYNRSRVELNERIRKFLKIQYTFIAKKEKIMCLRNNRQLGLFNGMQGIVSKVKKNGKFDFNSYGTEYTDIRYDLDQFGKEKYDFSNSSTANPFDYAYAITVHKAQGDSFGNIIVFEQKCQHWDHSRWAYTAASRARNGIIWATQENYCPNWL